MGPAGFPEFQCEACGKRFRWKPALAGRKARCPCGQVLQCPEHEPPSEASYDLAPEPVAPKTPIVSNPPAAQKTPVAPNPPAVPTLSYRGPQPRAATDVETLKNFHLPFWLLVGGLAVEAIAAVVTAHHNPAAAMIVLGLRVILGTLVMLVGVLIAAKVRGINLGSFGTAVLKLAAISVAPSAAADIVTPILMFIPFGGLGIFIIQFCLYFALLGVFFDLDESDTWYCVTIIFLIDLGVYFLAFFWAHYR